MKTRNNFKQQTRGTIAIICYGNIIENAGPASFANQIYLSLREELNVILVGTYIATHPNRYPDSEFYVKEPANYLAQLRPMSLLNRYFGVRILFRILKIALTKKAKVFNIHNLGLRIPLSLYICLRLLRVKIISSLHDYTAIYNRKLYPQDLVNTQKCFDKAVLLLNRTIINFSNEITYLSPQQSIIFQQFRFKSGKIIENKIPKCSCPKNIATRIHRDSKQPQILFLGRAIGKGLISLVDWVSNQNIFKLILAGGEDIMAVAEKKLKENQFLYLGKIDNDKIPTVIHPVDVVYCVSECYDVFPTVVLEALVHNKPVLVSNTCGNSYIIKAINKSFVVDNIHSLNAKSLLAQINLWDTNATKDAIRSLTDVEQFILSYKILYQKYI